MTPRHAADRVLARVRAWWTERRAHSVAEEAEEAAWVASLLDDHDLDMFGPVKRPGQRYQGEHAKPEDFGEET